MLLNAPLALILCFGLQFWPAHLVPLWVMTNMLLFSFAAGVLTYRLVEKVQFRVERYWGIGGAMLLVFAHAVIGPRSFSGWHLGSIEALRVNLGAMDNLGLLAQHSLETTGAAVLVAVLACNPIRLLQAAPLRMLGQISYSVYVAHIPALILVAAAVSLVTSDPVIRLALMVGITVPLSVAVATTVHLVVEKPGMGLGRKLQTAVLGLSSFSPRDVRQTVDTAEGRRDLQSYAGPGGYSADDASAKTAGRATTPG
ncbi:acyltransferase-like protein [Bradyrhizobium daqingense]|uniref:Acyltransferase-like protein n=2 Tax=Bradyrhizobium daqingense TaxID=993502 RepID=A0A562LGI2_9BRAD|nr:acyltransferase-like protein [Bradyrhizobium daqingense]